MDRRELLMCSGAAALALGASLLPFGWAAAADTPKKRVLMFTRSQGYEHAVVKRGPNNELSLAERIVTDLSKKHGFELTCTKDGREFLPETIAKYDAFLFETTGDLTKEGGDKQPPMPPEGKQALLRAIANGKGFVGCHCASDTFHSPGKSNENQSSSQMDPYIAMLGGEFIVHGAQQKARMHVVDRTFPGAQLPEHFDLLEEWYALKNFAPDLHVILVQDTEGMKGAMYQRPRFPATWARMHENGRVFYTSMGHREDVWQNPLFQALLMGGLSWALGNVQPLITTNLEKECPQAAELQRAATDKNDDKDWVQLFNGKDLTGWKLHPAPNKGGIREVVKKESGGKLLAYYGKTASGEEVPLWRVEDGILIGSGPATHLFSERDDYTNFHYRVEAMINDKGNSGAYFRTAFGPGFPRGYEAQIDATHTDPIRTGSLYPAGGLKKYREQITVMNEAPHKPDEWFTLDVIAQGDHITIKVNGKTTVDWSDPEHRYTAGHFALQGHDPGTIVKFKKIEVKELPAK
jgi:type 1 glutamine amidotransferase